MSDEKDNKRSKVILRRWLLLLRRWWLRWKYKRNNLYIYILKMIKVEDYT